MNADSKPILTGQALPFTVWIAAVDLLCLEAWQVDAYAVGPQPWYAWHSDGWAPERAVMELSTPATPPDIEDDHHLLNHPTVTDSYVLRKIMYARVSGENTHADPLPPAEVVEINLRYLEIEDPYQFPPATREDKARALARLGIAVQSDQSPIDAWTLAMCRENGLPEQRPAITIGEAAQELCPRWVWWLA